MAHADSGNALRVSHSLHVWSLAFEMTYLDDKNEGTENGVTEFRPKECSQKDSGGVEKRSEIMRSVCPSQQSP